MQELADTADAQAAIDQLLAHNSGEREGGEHEHEGEELDQAGEDLEPELQVGAAIHDFKALQLESRTRSALHGPSLAAAHLRAGNLKLACNVEAEIRKVTVTVHVEAPVMVRIPVAPGRAPSNAVEAREFEVWLPHGLEPAKAAACELNDADQQGGLLRLFVFTTAGRVVRFVAAR